MASKVSICNMALGYLNHAIRIAAIDEGSNEADQCALYYEPALRTALRAAPWAFAMRYETLADLGTPVSPNWTVMFAYPSDAVAIRAILPVVRGTPPNRWEVALAPALGTKVVMCDVGDATAAYTAFVDDPTLYDAGFVSAFAWALAAEMAIVLTGSLQLKSLAEQQFKQAVNAAFVSNGSEGIGPQAVEAEWVRGRYDSGYPDEGLG